MNSVPQGRKKWAKRYCTTNFFMGGGPLAPSKEGEFESRYRDSSRLAAVPEDHPWIAGDLTRAEFQQVILWWLSKGQAV